ncbi:CCDC90 family protein [Kineobactrum salinum]|uniref:DUF1640 domain-containing protein n=1 Tax=Kineobactrum salinum TaxID=2708301 RepID=A0A6C0U5D5_9GAMM|nr:hypothetical protein [Kineobactrum salinum]QIB66629.1 hypothetical protein G3T16_15765 [Kineobactrum salinum]
MSTLAFDSLQYARRLKAVGVPEQQAEVQAELMAEAFGFYADNIVTRDYLDATLRAAFAEQDVRLEQRFAEFETRLEQRSTEHDLRFNAIDQQFVRQEARMDGRFAEQDLKFTRQVADIKSQLRVLIFMVSGTWLLVGLPLLQEALAG